MMYRTEVSFTDFLDAVIKGGITDARETYGDQYPDQGFTACRDKTPAQLRELLREARCYEAEIGWVCNVVSALLIGTGVEPIVPITGSGVTRAIEIIQALVQP